MMTELDKLSALCAKGTPRPWVARLGCGICNKYIDENAIVIAPEEVEQMLPENWQKIVALQNIWVEIEAVLRAARCFVPDPRVIQWEPREIMLRDAFQKLDAAIKEQIRE